MPYSRIEEIISKYGRALGLTARTTLPEWTAALQQLSVAKTREAQIAPSPEIKTGVEQELADINDAARFIAQFSQEQNERQKKVLQKLRQAVQTGDPNLFKMILAEPGDQDALPKQGQPAFGEYLEIQNEAKAKWPDISFSSVKPETRAATRPVEEKTPPQIVRRQNVLKKLRQALQAGDRNLLKWMLTDPDNLAALPAQGEPLYPEYAEIQKEANTRWPEITFPRSGIASPAPVPSAPATPVTPARTPAPSMPAPTPVRPAPATVAPVVPKSTTVAPPPASPAPPPQRGKGMIIAVVAVVVLAAGGAVFMFSGKPAQQPAPAPARPPVASPPPPVAVQTPAPKPVSAASHVIKIAVWSKPRGTVFINDTSSNQKTDGWFDVPSVGDVKIEVRSPGYFPTNREVTISDPDNNRRVLDFGDLEPSGLASGERDRLESLRLIAFQLEHAATTDQRRVFARQYMEESGKFVKNGGNLIDVWTLRAKVAIELNMQFTAKEAGQKLLALGPDNANDTNTVAVVNTLKQRGWLEK